MEGTVNCPLVHFCTRTREQGQGLNTEMIRLDSLYGANVHFKWPSALCMTEIDSANA